VFKFVVLCLYVLMFIIIGEHLVKRLQSTCCEAVDGEAESSLREAKLKLLEAALDSLVQYGRLMRTFVGKALDEARVGDEETVDTLNVEKKGICSAIFALDAALLLVAFSRPGRCSSLSSG